MKDAEHTEIERAVAWAAAGYGRRLRRSPVWLYVDNPDEALPEHGWKLHISARSTQFERIARIVVPVLLTAGCNFKLARSAKILMSLNEGRDASGSIGKAFTVYPDPALVQSLGKELAELLRGESGPRILSDRRVSPDAPVYYRYGPFMRQLVAESDGSLNTRMTGPNGEIFDGLAKQTYQQPPWAEDPFGASDDRPVEILGDHYRPTDGLKQSGQGNVYRAEDIRTGEQVIVKQARAYTAEAPSGEDACLRLRNERLVLQRLDGIDGVPRFFDHFRHGSDEYLVTSCDGEHDLADDVPRNGRYRPAGPGADRGERTLDRLAERLARILLEIHDRGITVTDLSPKNVVIREATGEPTFIDFGLSGHDDIHFTGGTPGYSPQGQLAGAPATPADDMYALGMTLLFAATGAVPVMGGPDPDAPRMRALQTIRRIYGDQPPPSIRCVAGLLDADIDRRTAALRILSSGKPQQFNGFRTPDRIARMEPAELADRLVDDILTEVDTMLDSAGEWPEVNVYRGAAGVALELRHHMHRPDVAEAVGRLAQFTAGTASWVRSQPGLFVGSTGIEIMLRRVRAEGIEIPTLPTDLAWPAADWQPYGDDIIVGAAGVGLGHCLLAEAVPDERDRHLAVARECARALSEHSDAESRYPAEDLPVAAGLDTTAGLGHGQAGIITALLHMIRAGVIEPELSGIDARIPVLYRQTRELIERSGRTTAVPLCVSWCRGLAGIGNALLDISESCSDAEALDLAVAAGDRCAEWIPYLSHPTACCGIAGVGDFVLRLAETTAEARFTEAAHSAMTQLLLRGITDNPDDIPRRPTDQSPTMSWASGRAGILGFVRRLHTGDPAPTIGPF
ncbi:MULTISPECIES: lanthionine synthetase LanC family protein [unclassified Nocardia]|uniref:class III lanthionine synthetase LanKC N-terminal domain-containing protein n=1 Tax=unclassified Nocardia TaxID=2637762 RepID=UPI001CE4A746|nr:MULTISPECIES: lanthionine synthetase LanC family protein [unclassified Nocardia]